MTKTESKNVNVTARVTQSTKKKLEAIAKKKDRNISHVVNQIIENYFAKT